VDDDDEVLEPGRRPLPRWAVTLVAALVLAAVVAAVAARLTRGGPAAPRAGSATAAPSPTVPITQVADSADVVVAGDRAYVLTHGVVYALDTGQPGLPAAAAPAPITGLDLTESAATDHLVLDGVNGRLWMVTYSPAPATVVEFDAAGLTQLRRMTISTAVNGAAVLDGILYLATPTGVTAINPVTAELDGVSSFGGSVDGIVADPTRHRLLLWRHGDRLELLAFAPVAPPRQPLGWVPAPFAKGSLLVIDATIWAGGYGQSGAVLVRLDPSSLMPTGGDSAVTPQVGPGAVLVAAGRSVLWVRSGLGGSGLWCVDGATGAVLQSWDLDGPVGSDTADAVLVGQSGPSALTLSGCSG
jgi:hypothetical protein